MGDDVVWDTAVGHLCNNFGALWGEFVFPRRQLKYGAVWLPVQYRQVDAASRAHETQEEKAASARSDCHGVVCVW